MVEALRVCSRCKEPLPLSNFSLYSSSKDGHFHRCKACDVKHNAQKDYWRKKAFEEARGRDPRYTHDLGNVSKFNRRIYEDILGHSREESLEVEAIGKQKAGLESRQPNPLENYLGEEVFPNCRLFSGRKKTVFPRGDYDRGDQGVGLEKIVYGRLAAFKPAHLELRDFTKNGSEAKGYDFDYFNPVTGEVEMVFDSKTKRAILTSNEFKIGSELLLKGIKYILVGLKSFYTFNPSDFEVNTYVCSGVTL